MIVGAIAQISRCRQVPRAEEFTMAEITRLFAAKVLDKLASNDAPTWSSQ
jgi:hypothetical protein